MRNGVEAIELARRAVQLSNGREPAVLGTLAAACAEAGRFAEAVQTAHQALELATRQNKQSLVRSIEATIPLYEAQTPLHTLPERSPRL
jgi:cytochrome c-type biogenesis protein CcmH/NrfG